MANKAAATTLSGSSGGPLGGVMNCDTGRDLQDCRVIEPRSVRRSATAFARAPSAVDLWFSGGHDAEDGIFERLDWDGGESEDEADADEPHADHWTPTLTFGLPYSYSDSEIFDPAAITLLGIGLLGFVVVRRRKIA